MTSFLGKALMENKKKNMEKYMIFLMIIILANPTYAVQYARPDQDINAGSWTVTPLWSKINEIIRNDAEGNYINSSSLSGESAINISLTSIIDPALSVGHIIRTAARAKYVSNPSPNNITFTVTLFQGSTNIASFSHTKVNQSFYQYNDTLSEAQINSITDYSNLTLEFRGNLANIGLPRKKLGISWAEFEVPSRQMFNIYSNGLFRIYNNGLFNLFFI